MSVNPQPEENAVSNLNLILLVIAGVFGVLYLMRRKARLRNDD
jgi:hypothetical protein